MKKLLIAIAKGELGGAQQFALNLAENLKEDFDISFVVGTEGNYLQKELREHAIPLYILKNLKRTHNPFIALKLFFESIKVLNTVSPDVLHINSSNTLVLALAARFARKCPHIVFTFHGLSFLDKDHRISPFKKALYWGVYKFLLLFVDKGVFVSRKNKEEAILMNLFREHDSLLIENEIAPVSYVEREAARKFFSERIGRDVMGAFIIGHTGRLAYPKNQEFLINHFNEILLRKPESILIVIGDGPDREALFEQVKKQGFTENIFFIGALDHASRYLKGFDVFVLPSIYEGRSISLLEARGSGILIIASDVGANSEVLLNYSRGFIYKTPEEFLLRFKEVLELKEPSVSVDKRKYEDMIQAYRSVFNL